MRKGPESVTACGLTTVTPVGYTNKRESTAAFSGFSRTPLAVTTDPRLKHLDVRIYNVLSAPLRPGKGNETKIGQRLLMHSIRASARNIAAGLDRLKKYGHVDWEQPERGSRTIYRLLDPLFAQAAIEKRSRGGYSRQRISATVRNAALASSSADERDRILGVG